MCKKITDIELLLSMVKNKDFCGNDYKIHVLKNIDLERCFSFKFFFLWFKIQLFRWEETGPTVLSAGDCAAASKYILDAEIQEVCKKYRFSKYIH